jgi:hypothetical protein
MEAIRIPAVLLAIGLLASAGCYRQARYQVLIPSDEPLVTSRGAVRIRPMRFELVKVEGIPEASWLAGRSPREQALFTRDKAVFTAIYEARLAELCHEHGLRVVSDRDQDALEVRPFALDLSPGFWAFIGLDAAGRIEVDFADPAEDGRRSAIEVTDRVKAELWTASSESRMRKLAAAMAEQTMKYLAQEVL